MENGDLSLWDPSKILANARCVLCFVSCGETNLSSSPAESLILRNSTHTGPIRGLDFSPIQTSLLSSGGINGEVSINRAKSYISHTRHRSTFGTLKTPANHTHLPQAPEAPSSMRLHPLHGISKSSTSWLAPAAPDILSSGICGVRGRW